MIITIKRKFTDASIENDIREYGISRMAREVGMARSYLAHTLLGTSPLNEDDYKKIVKVLYDKNIEFHLETDR